jgi:hypothetical protein
VTSKRDDTARNVFKYLNFYNFSILVRVWNWNYRNIYREKILSYP